MWSSRYAPAVLAALIVALVPTLIHSYARLVVTDGRATAAIPATLLTYSSSPTKRPVNWGASHFDSQDWFEREYVANGDKVVLTVVRSYDLKALYHHPELAVTENTFSSTELTRFTQRPDIPVYVLHAESGGVALYALHYDSAFVQDPIRFQLRTAGELLFSGRKAMTLFFLTDDDGVPGSGVESLPSLGLFFAAIDRFTASSGVPQ